MQIGEYYMESPLMNGGGLVKTVEDVQLMAQTAVGAVLAGSFTLEPRIGNSPNGETVYYHDPETGITYNALGMPNRGMRYVAQNINDMMSIAHDNGKPFVLNFAPVSDNPRAEVRNMARMLADAGVGYLDGLELNASCPNVVSRDGGRHGLLSHHPEQLGDVLYDLSDISLNYLPIGTLITRISPFTRRSDALELARVIHDTGTGAVAAFNTFPGGVPLDAAGIPILEVPGGAGGRSGYGMSKAAEIQTEWLVEARRLVGGKFDVVASNGIDSGEAINERITELGAAAVSATTTFWEARSWGAAADRLLREYAEIAE